MTSPVPTLLALLRHVAGDRTVSLIGGQQATAYDPRHHLVTIEDAAATWGYEQLVALTAHEAAHVRLTHYRELSPAWSGQYPDVFNILEDGRVHRWLSAHFPRLRPGVAALEERAISGMSRGTLDAASRFLVVLRARAMGVPCALRCDDIEVELNRCEDAAADLVEAIPGRDDYRNEATYACARRFVELVRRPILPAYIGLLDRRRRARPPRQTMPTMPLCAEPQTSWAAVHAQVQGQLASVARALVSTAIGRRGWASGHRSGPRLDAPVALRATVDVRQWQRAFRRPDRPGEERLRVGLAVDMSGSMRGEPLEQMRRATVIFLQAAHLLHVPSSLVAFGAADAEATVLKTPHQSLAARRSEIERFLLRDARLGNETPMLAALEALQRLHPPEGGAFDLLIVVTDGEPTRRLAGTDRLDPGYRARCATAIRRLRSPTAHVVAIGVGQAALEGLFEDRVVLDDNAMLSGALAGLLKARLGARGR